MVDVLLFRFRIRYVFFSIFVLFLDIISPGPNKYGIPFYDIHINFSLCKVAETCSNLCINLRMRPQKILFCPKSNGETQRDIAYSARKSFQHFQNKRDHNNGFANFCHSIHFYFAQIRRCFSKLFYFLSAGVCLPFHLWSFGV